MPKAKYVLALALMAVGSAALAQPAFHEGPGGVWRNPRDSVHVEVVECQGSMCGTVIWANDKAKADAKRGGTDTLVGLQLFRGFTKDRKGVWHGHVFVPDINKAFSGTIESIGPDTRRGTGCLMGHFGCKSQDWTRVK